MYLYVVGLSRGWTDLTRSKNDIRRPTSLLTSTLSLQGVPQNGWSLFQTSSWNGPSHVSMLPRFYLRVHVLLPSDVFMLMYVFLKVFLGVTVKCSYPMSRKNEDDHLSLYMVLPTSTCLCIIGRSVSSVRSPTGYNITVLLSLHHSKYPYMCEKNFTVLIVKSMHISCHLLLLYCHVHSFVL